MNAFESLLPGVDLASLLAPISAASPAGMDLRTLPRSVYVEIENLLDGRSVPAVVSVDAGGRQISTRDERALTRSIADGLKRALGCLAKESKDLDVAALCVRGLLFVHGFQGLLCGLYVMRELHERFWESLYPNPPAKVQTHDDFDEPLPEPIREPAHLSERRVLSARGGAVEKMEHAVRGALRLTPLFTGEDGTACRIADWDAAKTPDAERTVEQLNALASSQPAETYAQLEEVLTQCAHECAQLDELLQQKYYRPESAELGVAELEAPSMAPLAKELADCRRFVSELRGLFGKKSVTSTKPGRKSQREATEPLRAAEPVGTALAAGKYQPKDRPEAISLILSAGQFLQRHEPLSPLPRLLFRLVHWARGDSLRPWLDDMFRTSDSEQESVCLQLGLDLETKLAAERLPAGCPVPRDRSDALAMLADVAKKLLDYEPLSPLPYHLEQLLALAGSGSPRPWLAHVFLPESPTLARIRRVLGWAEDAASDGKAEAD